MIIHNEKYDLVLEDTLIMYRRFLFVTVYMSAKGDITLYKFLGIPVWCVRTTVDDSQRLLSTKYYLFGFPVFEAIDEDEDSD